MTIKEELLLALRCMDLTSLGDADMPETIQALCAHADQKELGKVAAVCVYPRFVRQAASLLVGKNIGIATVINFPSGRSTTEKTVKDTLEAIQNGATEIDIVLDYQSFLRNDYETPENLINACRSTCGAKAKMKVILENSAFEDQHILHEAAMLALRCGADFLKTSTGKHPAGGASEQSAATMLKAIGQAQHPAGLKVSGGIKTSADAVSYINLVKASGINPITPDILRIGASSLLENILKDLSAEHPMPAPAEELKFEKNY